MLPTEFYAIIGIIAFVISIVGNISGFSGGVFLVPFLILFFYPGAEEIVIVSVILSLILPVLVGTIGAWRRKEVDWKLGLIFVVPSTIGAILGAIGLESIYEIVIVSFISVIAFIFGLRMLLMVFQENKKKKETENTSVLESTEKKIWSKLNSLPPVLKIKNGEFEYQVSLSLAFLIGLSIGLITGFFGVSGGWLQVPIFILLFGFSPLVASGTSLFVIVIKVLATGITYIARGNLPIDWWLVLTLTISMVVGASIGNFLKGKVKTRYIFLIIGIALLLIAIFTLVSTILKWGA